MKIRFAWGLVLVWAGVGLVSASETEDRVTELEEKINALASEVTKLKVGEEVIDGTTSKVKGLGPAASKVYSVNQGVSIGGYGEAVYQNFAKENQSGAQSNLTDELDFLRWIMYLGYKFNDRFVFNSEVEIEHGSTDKSGSVSVEFAYLDYLYRPELNFRFGMVLVPMGFINELHEPPIFLGVNRTLTETRIIPTTWRANGLGFWGGTSNVSYRFYLVNSFNGLGFSSSGLRGGRQKGSETLSEDFGVVGRVDYEFLNGFTVGASTFVGQTGQDSIDSAGERVEALTVISEAHADFRYKGAQFRGLFSYAHVNDTQELNAIAGNVGTGIGDGMMGYYAELGYDIFHFREGKQQLIPFVRYENVDTQYSASSGFVRDESQDQTIYTAGINYKPIPQLVFKGDYEIRQTEADTGVNQWNLGIGYLF